MELWKPLQGFDFPYEVSNLGQVRALPRLTYGRPRPLKILRLLKSHKDGYLRVSLRRKGANASYLVHRLVAIAFLPNPCGKPEVNHKDGDKHNNTVQNLEWVTASENQRHALLTGLRRLNTPATSKSVGLYDASNQLCHIYPSAAEAHRQTGVSLHALYRRLSGRTKGPLGGYEWRYM